MNLKTPFIFAFFVLVSAIILSLPLLANHIKTPFVVANNDPEEKELVSINLDLQP